MIHIVFAVLLSAVQPGTWHDQYQTGVRLIEQGQAAAALPHLEAALAARQKEGLQVPTGSQQYVDYLPHLYLAIAHQMSGNVEAGRRELALAATSGVASRSEVGRPLLVAYQLLLRGGANYAVFAAKPPVLTDEDFSMLRRDVLTKCNLPPDTKLSRAPWYANYEMGLELERKGDYSRALTHFIDAVANRPNPQRQARMYGMWLIDYYPYFHIARSHVRLQNWECARNALDISERLSEIPRGTTEMNEYLSLQRMTEQKERYGS